MQVPKEHQNFCTVCGQMFDMRDLSQVFAHEYCDGTYKDYDSVEQIQQGGAQKIGSHEVYYKGKGIVNLN